MTTWQRTVAARLLVGFMFAVLSGPWLAVARAQAPGADLAAAEAHRRAAIEKVRPAVVAVFSRGGGGGGSGVLIDADGYALTNFHVVQPCGNFMACGLADGVLYDTVLVGIDPVGDVALIKLLPKVPGKPFPFAVLGDSDRVRVGDWALAMGNPFLLATDFTPTITFGIISGTHRYQYPAGTILEYTDCLQTEASINPGNSGGPLFNLNGEIIGINGRGSFEKRGRVNSGHGYAISSNQIRHFLGHLRGGLVADHATLGAVVRSNDDGQLSVARILETSDAYRRGLREDDLLLGFADRPMTSTNQFKNVLGIYPRGWRVPMTFRSYGEDGRAPVRRETLVRLMGVQPKELDGEAEARPERPRPGGPRPRPGQPPAPPDPEKPTGPQEELPKDHPLHKLFEKKEGFANFYFNRLEQKRVWDAFRKHGDFATLTGTWQLEGDAERPVKGALRLRLEDASATLEWGGKEVVVEPLKVGESPENLAVPAGSGGLPVAMWFWRRLLVLGPERFGGRVHYGGTEPFYPQATPAVRVLADVLVAEIGAINGKAYFSPETGHLLGLECWLASDMDPCEVTIIPGKVEHGITWPARLEVRHADKEFAIVAVRDVAAAKGPPPADVKKTVDVPNDSAKSAPPATKDKP